MFTVYAAGVVLFLDVDTLTENVGTYYLNERVIFPLLFTMSSLYCCGFLTPSHSPSEY